MHQEFMDFKNIDATPQKYTCVQTRIFLWIRINQSDFQTYPYYFNHGASQPSLGSWAIERQNDQVKHYVSSSLLNHYSGVFMGFQNKIQNFYGMTLSSLSIYMVFVDPHQDNNDVMPFSFYN